MTDARTNPLQESPWRNEGTGVGDDAKGVTGVRREPSPGSEVRVSEGWSLRTPYDRSGEVRGH